MHFSVKKDLRACFIIVFEDSFFPLANRTENTFSELFKKYIFLKFVNLGTNFMFFQLFSMECSRQQLKNMDNTLLLTFKDGL